MIGWISRLVLALRANEATDDSGEISNHLYRSTISETKRGLFDYQLSKGVKPLEAFKLLAGSDYASETGKFVRVFATIEVLLLAISISVDKEVAQEYAFSFKPRLKETTEKVKFSDISNEEKELLLEHFETVASISVLRHRIMHWMLEDIPLPGKNYVFRNFSHKPLSRGTNETAEYSRSELAAAVVQADEALKVMSDFLAGRTIVRQVVEKG